MIQGSIIHKYNHIILAYSNIMVRCVTVVGCVFLALVYVGGFAIDENSTFATKSITQKEKNALCDVCLIAVDRFDTFIHEDSSKEKINKTLYGFCNTMHGKLREECHKMIPFVEEEFSGHFDANDICQKLSLCLKSHANSTSKLYRRFQLTGTNGKISSRAKRNVDESNVLLSRLLDKALKDRVFAPRDTIFCGICKTLVNSTESALSPLEEEIIKFVDEICGYLPDPTKKACTDTIDHYVPIWWNDFFNKYASPDMICSLLRLCS